MKQAEKRTNVHFASMLGDLMESRGVDKAELARGARLTPTAVGNYVRGRVPKAEELLRIAQYFDVSMEVLLAGRGLATNTALSAFNHRSAISAKTLRLAKQAAETIVALQDELKKLA